MVELIGKLRDGEGEWNEADKNIKPLMQTYMKAETPLHLYDSMIRGRVEAAPSLKPKLTVHQHSLPPLP
jgi:hypothetical protein